MEREGEIPGYPAREYRSAAVARSRAQPLDRVRAPGVSVHRFVLSFKIEIEFGGQV